MTFNIGRARLQNFKLLKAGLCVTRLLKEIEAQPTLWNEIKKRQEHQGTAHKYTKSIFIRWAKELSTKACFNDIESVDYPALKKLPDVSPLIQELFYTVKISKLGRVLIVSLEPGGVIDPHIDEGKVAAFYDRFHIALQSDEGNEFHCGDEMVHMLPGELWWFDNKKRHWLANNSKRERIHLIIDAKREKLDA